MPTTTPPQPTAEPDSPELDTPSDVGDPRVSELLAAIDEAAHPSDRASEHRRTAGLQEQQRLVEGRLGMASALFTALRHKHPASAEHSLRVALGCSSWAAALEMPNKLRTQLEIAALLHDIGKIGVPDAVLLKPGRLTASEVERMDRARAATEQILASAGAPRDIIDGVVLAPAWFDGSHRTIKLKGDETPVVARMIAIVDAFDSMTTDQVYRPARSRERAIATLYESAGTQFDPALVTSFCESLAKDQNALEADVARRWITQVAPATAAPWPLHPPTEAGATSAHPTAVDPSSLFALRLVDNMHDAVVFFDSGLVVTHWNTGAERLTGVGASAAIGKVLAPSLLDIANASGNLITDADCPIAQASRDGLQALERVSVMGRNGRSVSVDMHVIPVSPEAGVQGGVVLLHDATSEASLEERCQALHAEMTKDPMTQVANRAEFDRMLAAFVEAHLETGLPCSLIMADIDRFKSINDTYGHQAGDEAIMSFANLMKSMCRSGDLVARYGGEEFAILCADCTNATAAKRADQIRRKLSEIPHEYLGGKHITASFGVTELQGGDTPETMLRRADRALLQAKDQGRNQVVQLGDGMTENEAPRGILSGLATWLWGAVGGDRTLLKTRLTTNVPIELAVEKLRGFIADHDAKVLTAEENHLRVLAETAIAAGKGKSRESERRAAFVLDMRLSEEHIERANTAGFAAGKYVHTHIEVTIQPKRDRNRRKTRSMDHARLLLGSLKSYLMAREADEETPAEPIPA